MVNHKIPLLFNESVTKTNHGPFLTHCRAMHPEKNPSESAMHPDVPENIGPSLIGCS